MLTTNLRYKTEWTVDFPEQTGGKDDLMTTSPRGLHRVIEPPGVLPQAAWRLDASPAIAPDEVRGPADVTVVCVDVAGCEGGAILSTRQGGAVIFFSMATTPTCAPWPSTRRAAWSSSVCPWRQTPTRPANRPPVRYEKAWTGSMPAPNGT